MSVSLAKPGERVNLTKEAGGSLSNVTVGLGWNPRTTSGEKFDLDASVFVVGDDDKVLNETWFIYYGNLSSPDDAKSVVHNGDNRTGDGEGDDETISINLAALPAMAERVVLAVTIDQADARQQNFGQVRKSYIRISDDKGTELMKYDLGEKFSLETAMIFGEVYRNGSDWSFKAVGEGYTNGLAGLVVDHGMTVK